VKKKRMGFLQRIKSSSAAAHKGSSPSPASSTPTQSEPSPLVRANSTALSTSNHGPAYGGSPPAVSRKNLLPPAQPSSAGGGSVSPMLPLMRGKPVHQTSVSAKPAGECAHYMTPRPVSLLPPRLFGAGPAPQELHFDSSDRDDDSDCSGQFNRSPPGSPKTAPNRHGALSASPPRSERKRLSEPHKHRDKKTNAEASKLRNHISMTEYEMQRLQKSLRKRHAHLQALEAQPSMSEEAQQSVLDYNSEIQALHTQIHRLTARQQAYKDEYLELTGINSSTVHKCITCRK
jgi:hypothetical protein